MGANEGRFLFLRCQPCALAGPTAVDFPAWEPGLVMPGWTPPAEIPLLLPVGVPLQSVPRPPPESIGDSVEDEVLLLWAAGIADCPPHQKDTLEMVPDADWAVLEAARNCCARKSVGLAVGPGVPESRQGCPGGPQSMSSGFMEPYPGSLAATSRIGSRVQRSRSPSAAVQRSQGRAAGLLKSRSSPEVAWLIWNLPKAGRGGDILEHAMGAVFRLCQDAAIKSYKIGVTVDPQWRWDRPKCGYRSLGYDNMMVLHEAPHSLAAGILEACLIRHFRGAEGNQNKGPGGEGLPLDTCGKFFTYVVTSKMELSGADGAEVLES